MLLQHPGEVVTRRQQLQNALWSADTFVDFDHSLNAAVRRVRDALGDSAENPRFVETVARRGYRFLGAVNGAPAGGNAAPPPAAWAAMPTKHWPIVIATAMLMLGVVVGLGIAYWPRTSTRVKVPQFRQRALRRILKMTRNSGLLFHPMACTWLLPIRPVSTYGKWIAEKPTLCLFRTGSGPCRWRGIRMELI
jgi:hypothetical protein